MKRIIKLLLKILLVAVVIGVVMMAIFFALSYGFALLRQVAGPSAIAIVLPGILVALVLAMATLFVVLDEKEETTKQ